MALTVTNQQPAVLNAVHTLPTTGTYDPIPAMRQQIVDPLLQPLNPTTDVSIVDDKNRSLDSDDVQSLLLDCLDENIDPDAEDTAKDFLAQTMVNYDRSTVLPVGQLFASQAGRLNKMPDPVPKKVLYTATDDVVPAAKKMLGDIVHESEFFASLTYTFQPTTLGFWFLSSQDFEDFKTWLAQQVGSMSQALPSDTVKMFADVQTLSLDDLTESLLIRKDDTQNNDENSFARVFVNQLMTYVMQQQHNVNVPDTAGILPFDLGELFCPTSLVFVNVETHARTKPGRINREWKLINDSLAAPVRVVSDKSLSRLTALQRNASRMRANAATKHAGKPGARSAQVKFRKQPPSRIDLFKAISRAMKKLGRVNKSQNITRTTKTSFLKANRRDPDDYNKPGRVTTVSYLPDIHLYVDTSGSISESNYQEAVLMMIKVAKKLNVNLYFNSFSHIISQEKMLHIEGRSTKQIWNEFRRTPKVNGWTAFDMVWDYINKSPARRRQLSLMITDFDWTAGSHSSHEHPRRLHYAPCSQMDWDAMVTNADRFARSMKHIDGSVRAKFMGMNQ